MQIGLVQHADAGSEPFDPSVVGLDHAAWSVATRDELGAWEEFLRSKGVVHSPIVDVGPVSILNLKDPDGIALSLFWDRDGNT
jgi:catechol-2,3-dioxygenase